MKPRNECFCQAVAFKSSFALAPPGRFNISRIVAVLLPLRAPLLAAFPFAPPIGAFFGRAAFLPAFTLARATWRDSGLFGGLRLRRFRLFINRGHICSFSGSYRRHIDPSKRGGKQGKSRPGDQPGDGIAIEYGVMAAYAEGLAVLRQANAGKKQTAVDAETTPLRNPEHYQYELNLRDIAEVWRRGSVVASWLLDLTAASLIEDPALSKFAGRVSDSGEGRWTITAAIDEGVPAHVLSAALYERFSSRGDADFADKLLSAMRYQFGGHLEKAA
jgi:hypothetical protein